MQKKMEALIVEGGGMRGVFAAGVLDAFNEQAYDPFGLYFGVSAGACNLASHLAGQYKRNYRCYTEYMLNPEFISLRKYLHGGHFMDLDWFWHYMDETEILDKKAATELNGKEFIIVTTDVNTGKAVYSNARYEVIDDLLKGSSSVPLMYRNFVEVDGLTVTDGSVADPIPVLEAWKRGATGITVIRTRPSDYRKSSFLETRVIPAVFLKYPALRKSLQMRENRYREAVDFINNPPRGIKITEIAPDSIRTGRITRDRDIIETDYWHGHEKGLEASSLKN